MLHSSSEPVKPLNPDTYLNRLPPVEGAGYEILRDFTFAVGGVRDSVLPWLDLISSRKDSSMGCIRLPRYRHKDSEKQSF